MTVDSNSHFAAAFTLDMSERPPKLQWLFEFDREHVTVSQRSAARQDLGWYWSWSRQRAPAKAGSSG